MGKNRNQNNLLVEIMIAVLFFALCSTVILETFMAARQFNHKSGVESRALAAVQDVNEQLYAADDAAALLRELGFEQAQDGWLREDDEYRLKLVLNEENAGAGILRTTRIQAMYDDEVFAEFPGARYLPGGGEQ